MNVYLYAYRRTTRPTAGLLHGTMEADSLEEVLTALNEVTSDDGGEIIMISRIASTSDRGGVK
jgi:hypothetical protein